MTETNKRADIECMELCKSLVEDWFKEPKADRQDFDTFVMEAADNSAHITYYSKAWDLVGAYRNNTGPNSIYDRAEETLRDTTELGDYGELDDTITKLAYWLIYHEMYLQKELIEEKQS